VRRSFGDLRTELAAGGLALDARIRQTTSARYQAGAGGGGEYELRTLDYRIGSPTTQLTIGRQIIDAVGATRIDGAAVTRRLTDRFAATLFGGAYPALGSRSLDTDYLRAEAPGSGGGGSRTGGSGDLIIPITAGLGAAYHSRDAHGDLGVAAVDVVQDLDGATGPAPSRIVATSSGYWRIAAPLGVYHFAIVDVAGTRGAGLTNGSLGIEARPAVDVQLTAAIHHASSDALQIAARDQLSDPDPMASGIVQNNLAAIRISQDVARASASLALAEQRFELSASASVHRRPEVRIALADGASAAVFPESRSADATLAILDRRSIAGLRAQLSGTVVAPVGSSAGSRARGAVVRFAVSRGFAEQRGEIGLDAMAERFRDTGAGSATSTGAGASSGTCMTSRDALACYGASTTLAAQIGALASWRVGREWLVLADAHAGTRDVRSSAATGPVAWPRVVSIASFIRVQWRYR
jgi:hypothetical protein